MEKVKKGSLKREFILAVAVTLVLVAAASALTVWGCWALRRWLVPRPDSLILRASFKSPDGWTEDTNIYVEPDGDEVTLGDPAARLEIRPGAHTERESDEPEDAGERPVTAYTFRLLSPEFSAYKNGPRRGAAYIAAGAAMAVLPALYAVAGTVLCGLWIYRRKLAPAIDVLEDATGHISGKDLDFKVESPTNNELGRLCASFERMRAALYDNNLVLWRALEERRNTMASVAHDLRNPLAIMEGTVENVRAEAKAGLLTGERLEAALGNIEATAKRMERYTDYIRDIDEVEELPVDLEPVELPGFLHRAAESVAMLAGEKTVDATFDVPECRAELDGEIFYRVLENVVSNAVRYAKSRVDMEFSLRRDLLTVRVTDDGPGFSDAMLSRRNSLYYTEDPTGEHLGLGLATGRILCEKHGGGLRIRNREGGGEAEISFLLTQKGGALLR